MLQHTVQSSWHEQYDRYLYVHRVSKNDTDVARYNFNKHQLILVFFGRDVAETVRYQMVICLSHLS